MIYFLVAELEDNEVEAFQDVINNLPVNHPLKLKLQEALDEAKSV